MDAVVVVGCAGRGTEEVSKGAAAVVGYAEGLEGT